MREPTTQHGMRTSTEHQTPTPLAASHSGAEPSGVGRGTFTPPSGFKAPPAPESCWMGVFVTAGGRDNHSYITGKP